MVDASLSVNLAVAVAAALVGGALARLLGQSALVGYIAAGIVISPFTPGPISDVTTIERLADIGVIFLMFGIGIQFSLRDLVRSSAITLGAATQIVLSIVVGAGATLALGWTWHEALYAGAAAGMTSSTVVGKLLGRPVRRTASTAGSRSSGRWSRTSPRWCWSCCLVVSVAAAACRRRCRRPCSRQPASSA